MHRYLTYLKWPLGVAFATTVVGVAGNIVTDAAQKDPVTSAREFVAATWHWLVPLYAILAPLTLWSWLDDRRMRPIRLAEQQNQERRGRVAEALLAKPAHLLTPEDLGFQVIQRGHVSDSLQPRPYYAVYIERVAIPHHTAARHDVGPWRTPDLVATLRCGDGFVLIGQPTEGKTRTLYQVVKELDGYTAIVPRSSAIPSDADLATLRGHSLILVLDELERFASWSLDLPELQRRLTQATRRPVAVAATCRDGKQLETVRESRNEALSRLYENIPHQLALIPATAVEKGDLARGIQKPGWDPDAAEHYPTLGWVTMSQAFTIMKERFWTLSSDQQRVLRALRLLDVAGILPFTHQRVQAACEHVLGTPIPRLNDCLDVLTDRAFLRRPPDQDPVQPEPAYITLCVPYVEGRKPAEDFTSLRRALTLSKDDEGLFYLGVAFGEDEAEEALAAYDAALAINSDLFEAHHNRGNALANLGRHAEALAAYDAALALSPDDPDTHHNRGVALARLDRHAEAKHALCRAWQGRETLEDRGAAIAELLRALGHSPDACD